MSHFQSPVDFRIHVEAACAKVGDRGREREAAMDKNSALKFFAVRVPKLRRILKDQFLSQQMSDPEWLKMWDHTISHSGYYEPISLGYFFYLSTNRTQVDGFWKVAKHWGEQVENWGHCDLLGGVYAAYGISSWGDMEPQIRTWARSRSVWHRRLSIVSLVNYVGKSSTYLPFELVAEIIEPNLQDPNKYVSRPIGWVLREHLRVDPMGMPRLFIKSHWDRLPSLAKTKLKLFCNLEEQL